MTSTDFKAMVVNEKGDKTFNRRIARSPSMICPTGMSWSRSDTHHSTTKTRFRPQATGASPRPFRTPQASMQPEA